MEEVTQSIQTIQQCFNNISKTDNHTTIYHLLEETLKELFDSEDVRFLLLDRQRNVFYHECGGEIRELSMVNTNGLLHNSFLTGQAGLYNHIRSEKHYNPDVDNPEDMKLKAQIIYPLLKEDMIVAMVVLSRTIKSAESYTNQDLELLRMMESYLLKSASILLNESEENVSVHTDEASVVQTSQSTVMDENQRIKETMLFLSNTVHDIRTPANSLYGFLDLMEEQVKDEKLLGFINHAKESAAFINTLTDSILEKVKFENEILHTKLEQVNLVKFLADTSEIFTANMTTKGIDFLIYIDTHIPAKMTIDAIKLKRVLINLIGNAYKFTPTGKSIEFRAEYDPFKKSMLFLVKDTGLGIAPERQQEIFKAFEQASDDTSLHFGGTGLGLSISSAYVKELGGKLELESKPEVGSTFYFEIPVTVDEERSAVMPLYNDGKKITIYTKNKACVHAHYIKQYLYEYNMPEEQVKVSDTIDVDTTHLICFENKLDEMLVQMCKRDNIKLLAVEEKLFSISGQPSYRELKVISKNTYMAHGIYTFASCRKKPKVLIVDDNKINVKLIESILEGEYCELFYELGGKEGYNRLENALKENNPYDIVFLDKHMPGILGTEVIKEYRKIEKSHPEGKSIFAVSISGDMHLDEEEKALYDSFVNKPFKNSEIRKICQSILKR
jgi:two-component system sensor histidine kinase BarA